MDITLAAHGVAIPDRFKDYVDEKADKVVALAAKKAPAKKATK